MSAHWLLAAGFAGMGVAIFFLGWSARIMRVEWRDDRALRAAEARYERHTHRKGDPQETVLLELPRAGRLAEAGPPPGEHGEVPERLADGKTYCSCGRPWPCSHGEPPWLFAGESAPGWGSESAEYELLTRTAVQPASPVEGEPPIDTGELMAITDRVESWIASWTAQGNVDRHTIQAGE